MLKPAVGCALGFAALASLPLASPASADWVGGGRYMGPGPTYHSRGLAPAYVRKAILVFEEIPLEKFGNLQNMRFGLGTAVIEVDSTDFAAVELVRASLEAGSTDNVTCIVAEVSEEAGATGQRAGCLSGHAQHVGMCSRLQRLVLVEGGKD